MPTFDYGGHEITGTNQELFCRVPDAHVHAFRSYLRQDYRVELPEPCGSFVGYALRYWPTPEFLEEHPDYARPDDFFNQKFAFMIPPEKVEGFYDHLVESCEALWEEAKGRPRRHGDRGRYRGVWKDGPHKEPGEVMSFEVPAGGKSVGVRFNNADGEDQTLVWGVYPNGIVVYSSGLRE